MSVAVLRDTTDFGGEEARGQPRCEALRPLASGLRDGGASERFVEIDSIAVDERPDFCLRRAALRGYVAGQAVCDMRDVTMMIEVFQRVSSWFGQCRRVRVAAFVEHA